MTGSIPKGESCSKILTNILEEYFSPKSNLDQFRNISWREILIYVRASTLENHSPLCSKGHINKVIITINLALLNLHRICTIKQVTTKLYSQETSPAITGELYWRSVLENSPKSNSSRRYKIPIRHQM